MPAKRVGRAVTSAAKAIVGPLGTRVIERVASAAGRASTKPLPKQRLAGKYIAPKKKR